jgi:exodeoxyribonuclease-1
LIELAWRYQARNYPSSLSAEQTSDWKAHCRERLEDNEAPWLSFARYQQAVETIQWSADSEQLKNSLIAYMKEVQDYTANLELSPSD